MENRPFPHTKTWPWGNTKPCDAGNRGSKSAEPWHDGNHNTENTIKIPCECCQTYTPKIGDARSSHSKRIRAAIPGLQPILRLVELLQPMTAGEPLRASTWRVAWIRNQPTCLYLLKWASFFWSITISGGKKCFGQEIPCFLPVRIFSAFFSGVFFQSKEGLTSFIMLVLSWVFAWLWLSSPSFTVK